MARGDARQSVGFVVAVPYLAGQQEGTLVQLERPVVIEAAQARWRAVRAPHLVALVRAGARFECGTLVERPQSVPAQGRAA